MHNQLCLNLGAILRVFVAAAAAVYAPIAVSLLSWWRLISLFLAKMAPS